MYVGLSASDEAPDLTYLAVDANTRTTRWRTADGGTVAHSVARDRIYGREGNARLVTLDPRSGHVPLGTEPRSPHTSRAPLPTGRTSPPSAL